MKPAAPSGLHISGTLLAAFPRSTPLGPIPDDDTSIPDSVVGPALATARAIERYPIMSQLVPISPTVRTVFTQSVQQDFWRRLDEIYPRIGAKIDQPFGKENLAQTFTSAAALRHILLPLWKSGCLVGCSSEWAALCAAYYPARILQYATFWKNMGTLSSREPEVTVQIGRLKTLSTSTMSV